MRPDIKEYPINEVVDFATKIDPKKANSMYARRMRGILNRRSGMVCERDFGTVHRFATYPIRPNPFKTISAFADNGAGLIRVTTSSAHGFSDNDIVYIAESGTDQIWKIDVINSTQFDLLGSVWPGPIIAGGICTTTPITIVDALVLYDQNTDLEYDMIIGVDSSNNTRIYLYINNAWEELTRKITALVADASIGATDTNVDIGTIQENGVTFTLTTDFIDNWIVRNVTRGNVAMITNNTATNITCADNYLGSSGLAWVTGDSLEFYKMTGIYDGFNYSNGGTPHVRLLEIQQKARGYIYYGDSSAHPTTRTPLQIEKRSARSYFYQYTAGSPSGLVVSWSGPQGGWYVDKGGGGLIPFFVSRNTPDDPLVAADGAVTDSFEDSSGNVWMKITVAAVDAAGVTCNCKLLVTVLYDDNTKESDPIYQLFFTCNLGTDGRNLKFRPEVNFAKMNKRISGLRCYMAVKQSASLAFNQWVEDFAEYWAIQDIPFTSYTGLTYGTAFDTSAGYLRNLFDLGGGNAWEWELNQAEASGLVFRLRFLLAGVETAFLGPEQTNKAQAFGYPNILDQLNHAIDLKRSYLTPRFVVKTSREQGAVVIVDQDDKTLRASAYNGDKLHEEDNFPDVSVDNEARLQIITLNGRGQILGLEEKDGVIYIHRTDEIETFNLISKEPDFIKEPCLSGKSIVSCKDGLAYASSSGIRFLQAGGAQSTTLNPLWDNLYDGSVLIDDDSLSYITASYRGAIVGGYYNTLDEMWFAVQMNIDTTDGGGSEYVCFRYSRKDRKWRPRKIHIGSTVAPNLAVATNQLKPLAFKSRRDGTLMIVTSRGLLKYPYTSAAKRFQDAVYSDGRTSDRGIPVDVEFSIGGLANAIPDANVMGVKIQHEGESDDDSGFVILEYYRNNETSPFETKRFRVDEPAIFREFERAGSMESMRVRMRLPSDDLDNFLALDISQVVVGYRANQVAGNG